MNFMKNTEKELPENQRQSVIINDDATFENSSVDPGFVTEENPEKSGAQDDDPKQNNEQNEQGTERGAPGLGELDGTNPGSNHHDVD